VIDLMLAAERQGDRSLAGWSVGTAVDSPWHRPAFTATFGAGFGGTAHSTQTMCQQFFVSKKLLYSRPIYVAEKVRKTLPFTATFSIQTCLFVFRHVPD
jgi:hypothetical protein